MHFFTRPYTFQQIGIKNAVPESPQKPRSSFSRTIGESLSAFLQAVCSILQTYINVNYYFTFLLTNAQSQAILSIRMNSIVPYITLARESSDSRGIKNVVLQ